MFSREYSVDIEAPIDMVFTYVTDLMLHPEWSNNRMAMTVGDGPVAAGTTFETVVNAFGKETCKGKVIEVEHPTRFVYECDTSSSGYWRWTMMLVPMGSGTRLRHLAEAIHRPLLFSILQPVMFPFIGRKMMTSGLQNIKTRIEAEAGTQAATSARRLPSALQASSLNHLGPSGPI